MMLKVDSGNGEKRTGKKEQEEGLRIFHDWDQCV